MTIPLGSLRNLAAGFRPDTCTIQRNTQTQSGDGQADSWATVATVSCRVSRIGQGGNEQLGGDASITAIGQRRIKLPAGTDVTPADRIVCNGVTYEVADVPKISNEVERTVIAREVS
ncbi:MAG TPA: head-tail adaptor protein [Thermomicrobiales bacterium]|nr:head-tail adaptor protein [Thermomicrobiales bacterium]